MVMTVFISLANNWVYGQPKQMFFLIIPDKHIGRAEGEYQRKYGSGWNEVIDR